MIKRKKHNKSGQAMIALLLMISIVMFWATQTVVSGLGTVFVGNETTYSWQLLSKAEGMAENAAMRYLRDSSYQGESLPDGDYLCTIQVNNITGGKDLVSTCRKDNRFKVVGLTVVFNSGRYEFSKITER